MHLCFCKRLLCYLQNSIKIRYEDMKNVSKNNGCIGMSISIYPTFPCIVLYHSPSFNLWCSENMQNCGYKIIQTYFFFISKCCHMAYNLELQYFLWINILMQSKHEKINKKYRGVEHKSDPSICNMNWNITLKTK